MLLSSHPQNQPLTLSQILDEEETIALNEFDKLERRLEKEHSKKDSR